MATIMDATLFLSYHYLYDYLNISFSSRCASGLQLFEDLFTVWIFWNFLSCFSLPLSMEYLANLNNVYRIAIFWKRLTLTNHFFLSTAQSRHRGAAWIWPQGYAETEAIQRWSHSRLVSASTRFLGATLCTCFTLFLVGAYLPNCYRILLANLLASISLLCTVHWIS